MAPPRGAATGGDLYSRLGLTTGALLAEIKSAYRRKVVQLHPDKGGDPLAFAEVQEAYSVLSNSQRRRHYDETGRTELSAEESLLRAMRQPPQEQAWQETATARHEAWRGATPPRRRGGDSDEDDEDAPGAHRRSEVSTWLPPALRAAVQGRELERVPVPPQFEEAVPHITLSERDGTLGLMLHSSPMLIEDGHLREGEVLVHMQGVPLCMHELAATGELQAGDYFGVQGIGQVVFVGPRVEGLSLGDWVVPLREVDEDGYLREGVAPPGTARALAVFSASRCARFERGGEEVLSVGQMALAKSIGAAYHMVEQHRGKLMEGGTVIVNAANGVVGRVLVQLLSTLGFFVIAVVRQHRGVGLTRRKLEEVFGATKAFVDDQSLRSNIEQTELPLPDLAFDGIGGEATVRIASTLSRTGDLVCYGRASGARRQVLPSGWGKKWKGTVHQYSLDEWLHQNLEANSQELCGMLRQAARLIQAGRMQFDVEEYPATAKSFEGALLDAKEPGRLHAVVLRFELAQPKRGGEPTFAATPAADADSFVARAAASLQMAAGRQLKSTWDLDFLDWDEKGEDDKAGRRQQDEGNLFNPDVVLGEQRIQQYVDDSLAARVVLEIGAPSKRAVAVLFWLPAVGEVPEEHAPWLTALASRHEGLRVLVLSPKVGTQWYDLRDAAAIKLGMRYGVADDMDANPEGDPELSSGELTFPPLTTAEIDALQQVEGAALALHRRCLLEADALVPQRQRAALPFFLAGSGQGGSVALYTAACLLTPPPRGVAFCRSSVPVAGMVGKRISEQTRRQTKFYAIYGREDKNLPAAFPEALHKMLKLLGCTSTLEFLRDDVVGDFGESAADKVGHAAAESLRTDFKQLVETYAAKLLSEGKGVDIVTYARRLQSAMDGEETDPDRQPGDARRRSQSPWGAPWEH